MIKLRLNALSNTEHEYNFIEGENLQELVSRVLEHNNLAGENVLNSFCAIVDGNKIPQEFWEYCKILENSNILIAPILANGGTANLLVKIVAIVAAIVVTAYGHPQVGLAIAGLGSLAADLLIPVTPNLNTDATRTDSQMYSISGQSNSVNKYGSVPKVYGTHRMFPNIVGSPYTSLETDVSTGKLVQFFYAIYDFGYGPANISDIRIGSTRIIDFTDITHYLVDINKPEISEGSWDTELHSNWQIYKGKVSVDPATIGLNANSSAGGDPGDYEAIRNAGTNPGGYNQEISLDFVCPQGLYGSGTNGDRSIRTIELNIDFCKADDPVGFETWIPYNDIQKVSSYKALGGTSSDIYNDTLVLTPPPDVVGTPYSVLAQDIVFADQHYWYWDGINSELGRPAGVPPAAYEGKFTRKTTKYAAGTRKIIIKTSEVRVGDAVFIRALGQDSSFIGNIVSSTPITGTHTDFSEVLVDRDLTTDILLATYDTYYEWNGDTPATYHSLGYWNITIAYSTVSTHIVSSKAYIVANDTSQIFATFGFTPREIGEYRIRVTRVRTYSSQTYQVADALNWYEVVTRFDTIPVLTKNRHVFLELKIRATNQINGAVQNLSAIVNSVLDVYDPDTETWSKKPSNNPAWVFADLLTGPHNKRKIEKSRLDVNSLVEWADFCDEVPDSTPGRPYLANRFQSNFILDYQTTLQNVLNSVSNSCQASLNLIDGKYGVLIDRLRTVPVQIFTPRNSSGFVSSRNYIIPPDAIKVKYVDPGTNWQVVEKIVYSDGYDELNSEKFENLEAFACTNPEQAWRYGRYMMAQNLLRQEQITITVDFEYLVCTRGDYVQITQDVMLAGGQPARVKSVVGATVIIDDGVTAELGEDYGYVYRNADGIYTSTLNIINSNTFELLGDLPNVGDLIVIGKVGQIVFDCIVKSIHPNDELTAQIQLVEKADAVYAAESSMTLPAYNPFVSQSLVGGEVPPGEVQNLEVIANTWYFTGSGYQYYVDLDWGIPLTGATYEAFEIYVDSGRGYNLYTVTRESDGRVLIDPANLNIEHKFKVLAVSADGSKLDLASVGYVTATPMEKTAPPSDVDDLYINITNEVLQLNWTKVTDADIKEYLIRYSPITDGTWNSSIPLMRTGNVNTSASTQARTGTYLIKALDWNGNESSEAALAITAIPNLFNLNVVSETSDFPDLLGVTDQAVVLGGSVVIQNKVVGGVGTNEYYSEGFYYYNDFLDLGDIYSVRLQSLIQAEGYTLDDLMENWVTLSDLVTMSRSKYSEWDVETQVRATNTFNTMSDWVTMSSVDPISEGNQDNFTPWRSFTMGDFTGRIFQFRLRLVSNKASVSPRVFDGIIKADMPDRIFTLEDVAVAPGGEDVVYTPAFMGPGTSPNIQISINDAQSGDYWVITSKTLTGFNIVVKDKTDVAVARVVDIYAKGYGRRYTDSL